MKYIRSSLPVILMIAMMLNLCIIAVTAIYFGTGWGLFFEVIALLATGAFLAAQHIIIPPVAVCFIGAFLLDFALGPLRAYMGMEISSIVGFVLMLLFTYLLLKYYRTKLDPIIITLYILAGAMLLQFPLRLFDFQNTLLSLPDFLMHLLGVFAGYFFYERKKILHTINLSVSVLVVLFVYFYGYTLWVNKLQYGTFNGETHFKSPPLITLKTADNNMVDLENGKLTVMDFWFLGCGSCFDEFPEFQKLYKNYKNNSHIQFYSVNQPYPSDKGEDCFKALKVKGYTFPMAVADKNKSLISSLQVAVYPTVIVVDTDGFVVYKGDLKGAEATISSYLHPDND